MGISVLPAASGGGVKLVQRGLAASAGTITITSVNITKSFVTVFGTTSSGTVAATGTVAANNDGIYWYNDGVLASYSGGTPTYRGYISRAASAITGGTTTLVSAVIQGYLNSSTELVVSGPCRWEVVEFN